MAGVERGDIGLGQRRRLGELGLEPVDRAAARSRSNIQSASPSVHMFLQRSASLLPRPNGFTASSVSCEMLNASTCHLARLPSSSGLASYFALARLRSPNSPLVGDDQAAGLERVDIGLERRRVHRDQHVGLVARGLDRGRAEIDLEGGDAEQRALRRADLGREIGEGRQIVAGQRGRQRELPAGQLHAVAGIAGEADDDRLRAPGADVASSGVDYMSGGRHLNVRPSKSFRVT